MKLAEYDGQVEQSEGLKPRTYTIATNRKSFEVLSKSLYSDRIGAVIRELSTNAADANVAAEMLNGELPRPFTVHLPNEMEPFFSVEDYATGMTDKEIDTLYTTYFGSNRNTSNRFTGALGLGSKSPFTYGDQFTVVSTVNRQRRTYTCLINAQGLPDVVPLPLGQDAAGKDVYVEFVNAPNGVLVKVPVEAKDTREFETKAAEILQWFNPRPEVVGSATYGWKSQQYLIKNDMFGMTKEQRSKSHVVMGNVAYVVSPYDLQGLATHEQTLLNWGVDIWVDIGEVEIAANREKLTYTPDTKKVIHAKLKKIAEYLKEEAAKFLTRAKTIWEARRMLFDYKKGVMGGFLSDGKLKWNGAAISTCVYFDRYTRSPIECELAYKGRVHKDKNYPVLRKNPTNHVEADGSPIFIDDCFGGQKKIAYWLLQNKVDKCYILSSQRQIVKSLSKTKEDFIDEEQEEETTPTPTTATTATGTQTRPDIDESGLYETAVLASTLPDVPKQPRSASNGDRNSYTRLMRYKSDATGSDRTGWWANEKVDINDGGIYVVMLRFNVIKGGFKDMPTGDRWYARSECHPDKQKAALTALALLDEDEPIVYGIRPGDLDRLKKVSGWETLKDHVKGWLEENSEDYLPRVAKSLQFAAVESCRGYLKLKRDEFDDKSPFGQFLDAVYEAKKENENKEVKAFIDLCVWAGKPADAQISAAQKARLSKAHDRLQGVYPLLKLISPGVIDTKTAAHLTEYIQLLDGSRKKRDYPGDLHRCRGSKRLKSSMSTGRPWP